MNAHQYILSFIILIDITYIILCLLQVRASSMLLEPLKQLAARTNKTKLQSVSRNATGDISVQNVNIYRSLIAFAITAINMGYLIYLLIKSFSLC